MTNNGEINPPLQNIIFLRTGDHGSPKSQPVTAHQIKVGQNKTKPILPNQMAIRDRLYSLLSFVPAVTDRQNHNLSQLTKLKLGKIKPSQFYQTKWRSVIASTAYFHSYRRSRIAKTTTCHSSPNQSWEK
jgi:hypothetical protein